MDEAIWRRFETALRMAVPVALTAALTLVCSMPVGPANLGPVMPFLPAIAVFHWTVWRPNLMPRGAVFAIGLLHDGLTGAPLGMSAIALLGLQWVVGRRRRFFAGRTMPVAWSGFALLAMLATGFCWLAASLYYLEPMPVAAVGPQLCLTVACYPFLAWPFAALQRELLNPMVAPPR